jgi:tungstate transport system permease protein
MTPDTTLDIAICPIPALSLGPLLASVPPSVLGLIPEFSLAYLVSIVIVTLQVSLTAVGIATILGVLTALTLGFTEFPGKGVVVTILNTGMGFPSVVVGLAVLLLLSSSGPLGTFELLFTRRAMILSQIVLAFPVITSVSLTAIQGVDQSVRDAAFAAGGTSRDVQLTVVREARYGVITAILAGFGRAVSEVGSVLIVGGNIAIVNSAGQRESLTRTLSTAITIETRQGRYETGIALGVVLLILALGVNALGSYIRGRGDQ